MSFLKPIYVIPRTKPGGFEHVVTCNRWWSPRARAEARFQARVLLALRHPAAREALEESGNREARRKSKVAPKQLDRKAKR